MYAHTAQRILVYLLCAIVLLLTACGGAQKRISIDNNPKIKGDAGYVAVVVSISSEHLHSRIPYWQQLWIKSTNSNDQKLYILEAKDDIDSVSKVYLGKLPAGRYQADSLFSSFMTHGPYNKEVRLLQPLESQEFEFVVEAGQITNLQGIAYHDTDIFRTQSYALKFFRPPSVERTNVSLITRYSTDVAVRHFIQSTQQNLAVNTVAIPDEVSVNDYQQSLTLMPYLETAVVFDVPKQGADGSMVGNFGSWLLREGEAWTHSYAPTMHSLTALDRLDENSYLLGTEFGELLIYNSQTRQWIPQNIDLGIDRVALIDVIDDDNILIIQSNTGAYKGFLYNKNDQALQPLNGIEATRSINYSLEYSRGKAFRVANEAAEPTYFILDRFYTLDSDSARLNLLEGDSFLWVVQQGNDVLTGRPESFFTYRFGASYDQGDTWENALKATNIDDYLERRSFVKRSKLLLKAEPIRTDPNQDKAYRKTDFYVSTNYARSWDQVSSLDGNCTHILYGLSTDDQLLTYCTTGVINSSNDFGQSWQPVFDYQDQLQQYND